MMHDDLLRNMSDFDAIEADRLNTSCAREIVQTATIVFEAHQTYGDVTNVKQ